MRTDKKNYSPWLIDIARFYDQKTDEARMKFLLNFAVLAPSSHNSQPWAFRIEKNAISVFANLKRCLEKSDANNRQLFISLGCVITNITIAADYYGYSTRVDYLPDSNDRTLAAKIYLMPVSQGSHADKKHLIFAIPTRVNNRNRYDENRALPPEFLRKIKALATPTEALYLVSDENRRGLLADTALDAAAAAMANPDFRKELSQYVKSNLTKSKIGMPGFGLGFPTPISLIIPTLLKNFNMSKLSRKQDEALLKKFTPAHAIIATVRDEEESWLRAGALYERITLTAESEGIKTAVWAAPIQIGGYFKNFQRILNTSLRPQVFFRLGYTRAVTPHSPRLSAEETIIP